MRVPAVVLRNPVLVLALTVAIALTLLSRANASSPAQTPAAAADRGAPNFAIRALKPGEKPPQFVIFSFDGSGSHEKWQTFLDVAQDSHAQFTGFLTGIYLLDNDHRAAYTGPGHEAGKASVGFGGSIEDVTNLINDLNLAYSRGNEIGTHFNGHFCDGNDPSGNDWTTAQWSTELDEFARFVTTHKTLDAAPNLPTLKVPVTAVQGGRTPCLEGEPAVYFPAMVAHGMTYDSSVPVAGLRWPYQLDGLWEFGMPVVPVAFTGSKNIAMDYNFWIKFNGGANEPARAKEFTAAVVKAYQDMYDAARNGNRAPLVIGNHFNDWSGNAFNPAVEQFMRGVCVQRGTVCTTYQNVIAWMQAQDPGVLAELLARDAVLV